MKILKIKKGKRNTYEIFLEKETITIYDTVLLKYELLLKKSISEKELEEIKQENNFYEYYEKCLKYLNYKMRTTKEIKEYLKKENTPKIIQEKIIEKLKQNQFLDDDKYLECFINDSLKLSIDGPLKIKRKLLDLGIEEEKIENSLQKIEETRWQEKIKSIIAKKVSANHKDSEKNLKLKLKNYFYTIGYKKEQIEEEISKIHLDHSEILKKEEEKLRRKLERKYNGKELEFQIKKRLFQKGFLKEEIDG